MQQENKQSQTGLSKIKNFFTNSLFHIQGFFSKKQHKVPLNIFGTEFIKDEGIEEFKQIIWFTYRKNFPGLIKTSCYSDAGWGCMIRVGQMLLAQSLRRYNKSFHESNVLSIISAFIDDDENKKDCINYSIQKIAILCERMFKMTPGQWLSVSNISYILEEIHRSSPLRGYEKLKFKVFDNGALFYSSILKQLNYQLCKCDKKTTIFCHEKCHQNRSKFSIVILIMIRLGADKPISKFHPMLTDLFKIQQFNGMIGGKPSKALFFVGLQNEELIYLDPHFVQCSTNRKNLKNNYSSYFCQSLRTIQYSQIQPSAAVSFYIESLQSLEQFYQEMARLKIKYGNDFIIWATEEEEEIETRTIMQYSDQYAVSENSAEIILKESPSVQKPCSFDLDS